MSYDKIVFDAWLATAEIPYHILIPLLHRMNGAENIYEAFSKGQNELTAFIPAVHRKILSEEASSERMDKIQQCLTQCQIRSITILDAEYPLSLRSIEDPPGILFYRGNPDCLQQKRIVAMIGSRAASYDGLKASRKIARDLSKNGITVVSGLAYGIDSACHQGCIDGGSPTIAVMGCGLDQNYPYRNEALKKEILLHHGMLLSEYAPFSKAVGYHFPYRNRIISGLSEAVILMEARIRSGSMTTVDHALRQGKEVFAYPGDPTSTRTEGNHSLLRDGARYFTQASDILADMDWLDNLPYVGQNIECSSEYIPENSAEAAVCNVLSRGTLGFDEIISATGLTPSVLMSTLTVLQIRSVIEILPGKKYQIRQK